MFMDALNVILPVLLYIFGIILLIVLIILGIRMIQVLDKVDKVVDDVDRVVGTVEEKVNSFNGFFQILDKTSLGFSMFGERIVEGVSSIIAKIFNRKKNKEEDYYE